MTECGGCQNIGAHRKLCPRNPNYTPWLRLSEIAENLGDGIGPNDFKAANTAYWLASRMKHRHIQTLARKQQQCESSSQDPETGTTPEPSDES